MKMDINQNRDVPQKDDLSYLLGRCGHFLYHRPEKGRGQSKILKILYEKDSMTQKELQSELGIKSGSMSEILSKLESREMVLRHKDEKDRRKVILSITDKGRKEVEIFAKNESKIDIYQSLNNSEKETLKNILSKLVNDWYS